MKKSVFSRKIFYVGISALLAAVVTGAAFLPTLLSRQGQILLHGDFVTQQVPFLLESRRMIRSGTPFWSWNTFLGANFLGSYSFYTYGSPFFWPLVLVPEEAFTAGITAMVFLKQMVAAAGACLFLMRHVNKKWFCVLGGILYAFSFFSLDSSFYYHFMDVIALFPFFMWTLDRLLAKEKNSVVSFVLSTFILAAANYYFFVAISVFFLIYLFFQWKHNEAAPGKFKFYAGVVILYGAGALLASFILLPSAVTLLETTKAKDAFGELQSYLAILPQLPIVIKGLIMPHESINHSAVYFQYSDYCSNAGFVPLFGTVFSYIALKRWKSQWENKLLRFLLILALVPLGNGIFSLFSNILYTRWWFILVLFLILSSLQTLEKMPGIKAEEAKALYRRTIRFFLKVSFWITAPYVLLRVLLAYVIGDVFPPFIQDFIGEVNANKPFGLTELKYFLLLVFLLAVNYLILFVCIKRKLPERGFALVLAGMVVCILNYQGYFVVNEGYLFGAEVTPANANVVQAMESCNVEISSDKSYEYRTEILAIPNAAMQINRPGINTFHSIKSKATAAFGRRIGYGIGIYPDTPRYFDTPAIYALLSTKNTMTLETGNHGENTWVTTENEDFVPMGYSYMYYEIDDSPAPSETFTDVEENNTRIENMVKACYLDSETAEKLEKVLIPCTAERLAGSWQAAAAENRKNACVGFSADSSGFTATTNTDTPQLVYFSVPKDKGWHAQINGQETEIYTVNYGMMGVVVPAGEAEIVFTFKTPGLKLGIAISLSVLAGLLIAGGVLQVKARRRRRQGCIS